MKEYKINTNKKEEIIDITDIIYEYISKNNINNETLFIHVPHTTAGITINENADPDVKRDIIYGLKIFDNNNYHHMEGNSAAHIKSSLMGFNLTLKVKKGCILLGTWQGIMFCEFDGPRNRKIIIDKI